MTPQESWRHPPGRFPPFRLSCPAPSRAVIAAFREQEPDFTVATMENFAFQNRAYLERWMADLRTAGLPD